MKTQVALTQEEFKTALAEYARRERELSESEVNVNVCLGVDQQIIAVVLTVIPPPDK